AMLHLFRKESGTNRQMSRIVWKKYVRKNKFELRVEQQILRFFLCNQQMKMNSRIYFFVSVH
ncbi:hypothetical protein, partial [Escherichia coli]|uniref:hypothetical protein n=1 Tax=Escherichia coli TaxID=562 RepID=UPI003CE95F86